MKILNLLLISFFGIMLSSCNNMQKKDKITTIDSIKIDPVKTKAFKKIYNKDTLKVDILVVKKRDVGKNPKLKVVINGKKFYKKNITDKQKGSSNSYVFFDVVKKNYYDIRTREYSLWEVDVDEETNQ